tara:strand:+ start:9588 stop:9902 length:315 start_codon:yes stop_codon:yes gene_type:complete
VKSGLGPDGAEEGVPDDLEYESSTNIDMGCFLPSISHRRRMKQRLVKRDEPFLASTLLDSFDDGLIVGIGEVRRIRDVFETHDEDEGDSESQLGVELSYIATER